MSEVVDPNPYDQKTISNADYTVAAETVEPPVAPSPTYPVIETVVTVAELYPEQLLALSD